MKPFTTCLWFDNKAEDAVNFYKSVFPDLKIGDIVRYGKEGPGPEGSVLTMAFEMNGQKFVALNGGPHFKFNEAISFIIHCDSQADIDKYWSMLTADGGQESMCGWLKDKFGLSWQVVPSQITKWLNGSDRKKSGAAMQVLLKMRKLDMNKLQETYDNA